MTIWIHKSGIMKYDNINLFSMNAQIFWLIGITSGIFNEIYKLEKTIEKIDTIRNTIKNIQNSNEKENEAKKTKIEKENDLLDKQKKHYLILIQYFCDFFQPISSLSIYRIDPIYLALFGIISSILGIYFQWIKVNG